MKTHAQLSKAKDGVVKTKNSRLTQLGGKISVRITSAKNALKSLEITDEYFFGYTDIHSMKSKRENAIVDSEDLEVRYGLL
ncbi:hypothetical protein ACVWYG_002418 [Pedobacter sp. UYEF25]